MHIATERLHDQHKERNPVILLLETTRALNRWRRHSFCVIVTCCVILRKRMIRLWVLRWINLHSAKETRRARLKHSHHAPVDPPSCFKSLFEQFSIVCRKNKTNDDTGQSQRTQTNSLSKIKTRSKYENVLEQVTSGFRFFFWLAKKVAWVANHKERRQTRYPK